MRFVLALLGMLLVPGLTRAQVQINSLQSLLQYADEHAPASQMAKLQPLVTQQDVRVQASGLYPKINAFATGDYYPLIPTQVIPAEVLGGKPGTYLKAQFGLPYVFTTGAEVSLPVVNLEKWAQLSKARAQYQQSLSASQTALENFHIMLAQVYYKALVTKEVLKLNDENRETSDELLRIIDARNSQGVVNPQDLNRTRNLQIDVQTAGVDSRKSLEQTNNALTAILNLGSDSVVLSESIEGFSWSLLPPGVDASGRPAWQEADMKVRVAQLAFAESKKAGLPKLALNGKYAYNMQSKFESGVNNVEFDFADVGLRLDFPLFQGNFYRSTRIKNGLQLKIAKLGQQQTRDSLTQQMQDWHTQYNTALAKHSLLEQKVKNASDNLRIARLNIKEGLMEFDEFNNIFMEYNRAKIEYLQNLADGILYYLLSTQKF